jgi:hypothetical protein
MAAGERTKYGCCDLQRSCDRQFSRLMELFAEGASLDQLHHNEWNRGPVATRRDEKRNWRPDRPARSPAVSSSRFSRTDLDRACTAPRANDENHHTDQQNPRGKHQLQPPLVRGSYQKNQGHQVSEV